MTRTSVMSRIVALAILIALVLASLPMSNAVAKGDTAGLENKWSQLVSNYNTQSINHNSIHKWVNHWLMTNKTASNKADVLKHLSICNSAIMAAGAVVSKHTGFDQNGKVVDRAAALKSIKDLGFFLRQHAGSMKNLSDHIN
jgi:hypothetical protein